MFYPKYLHPGRLGTTKVQVPYILISPFKKPYLLPLHTSLNTLHLLSKTLTKDPDIALVFSSLSVKLAPTSLLMSSLEMTPTTFPLSELPNEILHMVFEELTYGYGEKNIASLRLVCNRFADIGNKYLLSEVNLFYKSSQFEQLRRISEHPVISQKVESLFCDADTLTPYVSLEDWKAHNCVPIMLERQRREEIREEIHPPTAMTSERERRVYRRNRLKEMQESDLTNSGTLDTRAYKAYATYLADQNMMRAHDWNVEMLKEIMSKMKNLKSIEMSTESCLNNGHITGMEKAFKNGLSMPYGDRENAEGCGVGQLRSLLLAADSAGLKLNTLCFGNVDWRFFKETDKHNVDVLQKLQSAVRSLRTLRLYVSATSHRFYRIELIECGNYLHETSHLKNFITATPDLERLDINFEFGNGFETPPATLCDSVGDFKWHALRVAAFAYISADEDCLANFFTRHASTLRKIRLERILLDTGSWPCLLQRMRKSLMIEQAALSGVMRSNDTEERYDFDLPAGQNGGKRAKFEVVVEQYLLRGGNGPLLKLNRLAEKYKDRYVDPEEELCDYICRGSDEYIMDRF